MRHARIHVWLAGCMAVLLAPAAWSQAPEAPWVAKTVQGVRFSLAVESILEPTPSGADPKHARFLEHRLVVSIRDEATGRAARIASASADVAEHGYTGATVPLSPVGSGEETFYVGRVRLSTKSMHRILVRATPAGGERTLEAQFEYRHHH